MPSDTTVFIVYLLSSTASLYQSHKSRVMNLGKWAQARTGPRANREIPGGPVAIENILYQLEIQPSVAWWRKDLAIAADFRKLQSCW